jgi:glycine cleavage system H protein
VIKEDLKYSKDHEWLRIDGDEATVGITDFAQGELGDIVFVELPEVGSSAAAGEAFGTIEAVKTVAELFAPVSGEVTAINDQLEENAALVNSDPYGEGWIIKIKMSDPGQVDQLLSPDDYKEMTAT